MRNAAIALLPPMLLVATAAQAMAAPSMWTFGFNQGIGQYSTGEWDRPTGGAMGISCRKGGNWSIMTQIKGEAPPAGSTVRFTTSTRSGSKEISFRTGRTGAVEIPAGGTPAFRQLWANLRAGDIVTVRYADGRQVVLSLDGAARTLPATTCSI